MLERAFFAFILASFFLSCVNRILKILFNRLHHTTVVCLLYVPVIKLRTIVHRHSSHTCAWQVHTTTYRFLLTYVLHRSQLAARRNIPYHWVTFFSSPGTYRAYVPGKIPTGTLIQYRAARCNRRNRTFFQTERNEQTQTAFPLFLPENLRLTA